MGARRGIARLWLSSLITPLDQTSPTLPAGIEGRWTQPKW